MLIKEEIVYHFRKKSQVCIFQILDLAPDFMTIFLELSLYELHRRPHEAITDDTEIAISPRSLHSELMCPICLDMLKNTMTTKEVSNLYFTKISFK